MPDRRIHLVHIITTLQTGGAEMMLYKLLTRMDRDRYSAEVVSLTAEGRVRSLIEALDVKVTSLDLRVSPSAVPVGLHRLRRLLVRRPGAIVQTWMYHSDLLGGLAARLTGRAVLWGVQGSNLDPSHTRRTTRLVANMCARLSWRIPRCVICCGQVTSDTHIRLGYDPAKMVVIPNAVDVQAFKPEASARDEVRRELGLGPGALLVGMAARFDPQKDHQTFIDAVGRLKSQYRIDAHAVLFGREMTRENAALVEAVRKADCEDRVHLLGLRSDVERLLAACDVGCLSSAYGEGLPNAVLEAMACELPCVVTDVGDSRWVVDRTGRVVPPRTPAAFAAALAELLSLRPDERLWLGREARRRVSENFELESVARRYHDLYAAVATGGPQ